MDETWIRHDVSFVVPAHNEEANLPLCLQSILDEILRDGCRAELVLVDNASTDRTWDTLIDWSSSTFSQVLKEIPVTVVHEPRKGLGWARKTGCGLASGRLIANVDADVTIPTGWLGKVRAAFDSDPDLVLLSGPHLYPDLDRPSRILVKGFYSLGRSIAWLRSWIDGGGVICQGGNFVFRREEFLVSGGFNTEFQFYGEDSEIARRLAKVGRVAFDPNLTVVASSRRFQAEGLVWVGMKYGVNYLWTHLFGRPFSLSWKDHR